MPPVPMKPSTIFSFGGRDRRPASASVGRAWRGFGALRGGRDAEAARNSRRVQSFMVVVSGQWSVVSEDSNGSERDHVGAHRIPRTYRARQRDAEVAQHVPPDRVDVVGAVLGVVELDQEGRALDAVGMGLAAVGGAGPGEADGVEAGAGGSRRARPGRPRRACPRRRTRSGPGAWPAGRRSARRRRCRRPRRSAAAGCGRARISPGAFAAKRAAFRWLVVERLEQAQAPGPRDRRACAGPARSLADLRRVGAEERGRRRDDLAVLQREVEREVMPLDPPAPLAPVARRAEDRQEVQLGIADRAAALLQLAEDLPPGS